MPSGRREMHGDLRCLTRELVAHKRDGSCPRLGVDGRVLAHAVQPVSSSSRWRCAYWLAHAFRTEPFRPGDIR